MAVKPGKKSAVEIRTEAISEAMTVVDATGARIQAPEFLEPEEIQEWNSIVESLPADYFRASDISLLSAYCVSSALYKQCRAEVKKYGLMMVAENGRYYANPAAGMMQQQASAMSQMSVKLRLAPQSRYSGQKASTMVPDGQKGDHTDKPWKPKAKKAA
jgi:P27 family predicted phage terminase small subunit